MNSDVHVRDRINLLDYLMVLVRYRRFIFLNSLAVCLIVGLISLLLPSWYTASTTLLPPEKETPFIGLTPSLLGGFSAGSELSLPLMATPSDLIAAILRSRTVGERVIEKAGLMEVYHTSSREQALKELASRIRVKVTEEGMVSMDFEDRDRERAAEVANLFIQEVDHINRTANTSRARNTRLFIENRMEKTQKDLTRAEEDLREFQELHKTISLDEQMKTAIQTAANLRAEMVMNEIELNVLSQNLSFSHPRIQQLNSKIYQIRKQLDKLEFGDQESAPDENQVLDMPFAEVPKLSLQLARLTRDLKIQEAIFELLSQQYEEAKIQEAKDTPTIQVLDRAVPPEKRSRPRRATMVVMAAVASLFVGTVFVFGLEYLKASQKENPEGFKRIEEAFSALREDLQHIKGLFLKSKREEGNPHG